MDPIKRRTPNTALMWVPQPYHLITQCVHQRINRQRAPNCPRSFKQALWISSPFVCLFGPVTQLCTHSFLWIWSCLHLSSYHSPTPHSCSSTLTWQSVSMAATVRAAALPSDFHPGSPYSFCRDFHASQWVSQLLTQDSLKLLKLCCNLFNPFGYSATDTELFYLQCDTWSVVWELVFTLAGVLRVSLLWWNAMTGSNLWRKGLIPQNRQVHHQKKSGKELEAGTEADREVVLLTYWLTLRGLLSLLSFSIQDHYLKGDTTPNGLGSSTSISN